MKVFVGNMIIINKKKLAINTVLATTIMMGSVFLSVKNSMAANTVCHPLLWPAESLVMNPSSSLPQDTMEELQTCSEELLHKSPHPVKVLCSSGQTDIKDPSLEKSRNAFKDADRAAVLALTYRLTNNPNYLKATLDILTAWAKINHPTGNPIDETRLEGMVWAYDLISCDLSAHDKNLILNWLKHLQKMKMAWKFGDVTRTNNHRIHQLKMILLLDKILPHHQSWNRDLASAEKYSSINLNNQSGVSIDYLERNALYYQNYVMQPWLEISLISGCCERAVKQGFSFLSNRILSHQIGGEFLNSAAPIDTLRAHGGFEYAKKGGQFDVKQAAPTIVSYYTLVRNTPNPDLWFIQQQSKPSPWMVFLNARRNIWKP